MKTRRILIISKWFLVAVLVFMMLPCAAIAKDTNALEEQLREATQAGDVARVRALLEKGADVSAKDQHGRTPLDLAWKEGHQEIEKILKAYGAFGSQYVYDRNGNIFLRDMSGAEIQLSSSGHDSAPSLSPNGELVVFVCGTSDKTIDAGAGDVDATQLWIVDICSKKAKRVLNSKASGKMQEVLAGFSVPQFSQDSKSVYFLSAAWVTSCAVHLLDLTRQEEKFIAPGNSLKVMREGQYQGYLIVNQHRYYEGGGSYDADYLLSPEGQEIKKIEDPSED
jgi:hypothetical protein